MRKPSSASLRVTSELDSVSEVVNAFEDAWRDGPPPLERFRDRLGPEASTIGLAELVMADLQNRYKRGERPSARDYFNRFPALAESGRALSLIYEEFCLRAEVKEAVDSSEFCRRYPSWRDSLVSQLQYHRELSRAVEPAPSGPEFPDVGDRFADYDLVAFLGQGAAAEVFVARAINLGGKEFVLKISLDRGSEPAILGQLDHPNIVPVLSSIVDPKSGLRGLVMPYRPGLPLDRVLKEFPSSALPRTARGLREVVLPPEATRSGRDEAPGWTGFPRSGTYPEAVAWLGMRLAMALAHAHGRGFFHRDVKPENILLTNHDGPQILDFNLAHDSALADQAIVAHRGGTLPYMAREHLDAFLDPTRWGAVGAAADLFSLGLILRELLTGQVAWRPPSGLSVPRAIAAIAAHRGVPDVPIRRLNPDVPHGLDAIVGRCLAESPADRYSDAASLAEDLGRFLDRRPLLVARNPSRVEATVNRARRNRVALAIGLAAMVLASTGTYLYLAARTISPESHDLVVIASGPSTDPKAIDALRRLVDRPDAAVTLAEAWKAKPKSISLGLGLGYVFTKAGQLGEAAATYRQVLAVDPLNIPSYDALIKVENERGHHDDAIRLADEGIAHCRQDPPGSVRSHIPKLKEFKARALLTQGDAHNDRQDFALAMISFGRAMEVLGVGDRPQAPDDPEPVSQFVYHKFAALAHSGRMIASAGLSQFEQATAERKAALDQVKEARVADPTKASTVDELGRYIEELGRKINDAHR